MGEVHLPVRVPKTLLVSFGVDIAVVEKIARRTCRISSLVKNMSTSSRDADAALSEAAPADVMVARLRRQSGQAHGRVDGRVLWGEGATQRHEAVVVEQLGVTTVGDIADPHRRHPHALGELWGQSAGALQQAAIADPDCQLLRWETRASGCPSLRYALQSLATFTDSTSRRTTV